MKRYYTWLPAGMVMIIAGILSGCGSVNVHSIANNAPIVKKTVVPVIIDSNSGNLKLSQATMNYLSKYADPKVFKSFTIVKVAKDNKGPMGTTEWIISLIVRHQPGRTSAYTEGLNRRIVGFTDNNGSYIVTSLATGG